MRALCIEQNVVTRDCDWYGKGIGCGQTCPPNYVLISQNTHPDGSGSGCKSGYYSSYCCSSVEASNIMDCSESAASKAITGGLNLRAKSLDSLTNSLNSKGDVFGTLAECAADAYNDGVVGELVQLGTFAAGMYILSHVPGHWASIPRRKCLVTKSN